MKKIRIIVISLLIMVVGSTSVFAQNNNQNKYSGVNSVILAGRLLSFAVSTEEQMSIASPGKWVNSYGFVYYQNNERQGLEKLGFAELFLKLANGIASTLTDEQLNRILDIASEQQAFEEKAMENRNQISRELYQWRNGVDGNQDKVTALAEENGELLYKLLSQRTKAYGDILQSLSTEQWGQLYRIREDRVKIEVTKSVDSLADSIEEQNQISMLLGMFLTWATGAEAMNQVVDASRPGIFFGYSELYLTLNGVSRGGALRKLANNAIFSTMDQSQLASLETLVEEQKSIYRDYIISRGQIASMLMGYKSSDADVNEDRLREICLKSETIEAQLAMDQADSLSDIMASFSAEQWQGLRDFKEGEGILYSQSAQ